MQGFESELDALELDGTGLAGEIGEEFAQEAGEAGGEAEAFEMPEAGRVFDEVE